MTKKSTTKSAVAFIKNDPRNYDERAAVAKRESVALLMNAGIADFEDGMKEITDGGKCIVRGANKLNEAGRKFDEAEKIGQSEFRFFSTDKEGWARDYERKLKIKAAQKIHRLLKEKGEKIENLDQAAPVMHQLWILSGQIKQLRRIGGETVHLPPNPFNAIIDFSARVESSLREWEPEDSPVETYYSTQTPETLKKIEVATRPIAERHALVERLLKEKEEA